MTEPCQCAQCQEAYALYRVQEDDTDEKLRIQSIVHSRFVAVGFPGVNSSENTPHGTAEVQTAKKEKL